MDWRRWYALDAVDDALYRLRYYFVPFDLKRYLVLLLVTSVVGARAGYGVFGDITTFFAGVEADLRLTRPAVELVLDDVDLFVAAAGLLALFLLVSAVFEFVFVDVLAEDEIRLRRLVRSRWREGLALFGFRVAATIAFFATSYIAVGLYRDAVQASAAVAPLVVGVAAVAFATSLVNGLTTDFVVPIMVVEDHGLGDGWVKLVKLLKAHPSQFGFYVVFRGAVNAFVLVGATVVSVVLGATLALPLAGFGYASGLTSGGLDAALATAAGVALVVTLAAVYVFLLILLLAVFVQLPVRLFLRCYPIYVLGYVDDRYAILEPRPADISLLDFVLGRK